MTLRGTPNQGLAGATFGFFIGFAAVSLFGPTASLLREALDLSPFAVSWLIAVPALSGSLLRIPFSAWVDTTGGRKPFLVLLSLSIAGMVGLLGVLVGLESLKGASWLYPLLLALGALVGCGIATFSVGVGQVSYWFGQDKQGRALGTFAGGGNLGPGALAFVLPFALAAWGLVGTYLAWLVLLIGGTAVYALSGRNAWYFQLLDQGLPPAEARKVAQDHGQQLFPRGKAVEGLRAAAGIWKTWVLVGVYFTTFGGFIALTSWFPTYWEVAQGVSGKTAGGLTALFAIGASLVRIPGGAVADRVGGERTLSAALVVMGLGALLLTMAPAMPLAVGAILLLALGMGVSNAAVFKLVPQEVPQAVGGAAGWVGGLGAFGGFAIPPAMAAFVSASGEAGYAQGFFVFVLLAMGSLAAAALLQFTPSRAATTEAL